MAKRTYSKKSDLSNLGPLEYPAGMPDDEDRGDNGLPEEAVAFLDTISNSESNGVYNVVYGGDKFNNYEDHPRIWVKIASGPNKGKYSSAAGKYQFIAPTWNEAKKELGLKDFSPANQDKAAWWLAQRDYANATKRNLLEDLRAGGDANMKRIGKTLSTTWTSLPGGIEQGQNGKTFADAYNSLLGQRRGGIPVPPVGIADDGKVRTADGKTFDALPAPAPLTFGGPKPAPAAAKVPSTIELGVGLGRRANASGRVAFDSAPAKSSVPAPGLTRPGANGKQALEAARPESQGSAPYFIELTSSERAAKAVGKAAAKVAAPVRPAAPPVNIDELGTDIDRSRLNGYREIQEMGPSSKGAAPNPQPAVAPKPGAIKTTNGQAQTVAMPRDVRPSSVPPAPESAPTVPKYIVTTTKVPIGKPTDKLSPETQTTDRDMRNAISSTQGVKTPLRAPAPLEFKTVSKTVLNPEYVEQQRVLRVQAQARPVAGVTARMGGAIGLNMVRPVQPMIRPAAVGITRAPTMSPAGMAAANPGISHSYSTVAHAGERTDVHGNDMNFQPRSVQTSDRHNTGY